MTLISWAPKFSWEVNNGFRFFPAMGSFAGFDEATLERAEQLTVWYPSGVGMGCRQNRLD